MSDLHQDFDLQDGNPPSSPSFEERLSGAASDYETLNAESVADLGI